MKQRRQPRRAACSYCHAPPSPSAATFRGDLKKTIDALTEYEIKQTVGQRWDNATQHSARVVSSLAVLSAVHNSFISGTPQWRPAPQARWRMSFSRTASLSTAVSLLFSKMRCPCLLYGTNNLLRLGLTWACVFVAALFACPLGLGLLRLAAHPAPSHSFPPSLRHFQPACSSSFADQASAGRAGQCPRIRRPRPDQVSARGGGLSVHSSPCQRGAAQPPRLPRPDFCPTDVPRAWAQASTTKGFQ